MFVILESPVSGTFEAMADVVDSELAHFTQIKEVLFQRVSRWIDYVDIICAWISRFICLKNFFRRQVLGFLEELSVSLSLLNSKSPRQKPILKIFDISSSLAHIFGDRATIFVVLVAQTFFILQHRPQNDDCHNLRAQIRLR